MLSLFFIQDLKAQAVMSPALSPAIEWKDIFWPPRDMAGDPLQQEDSDEDWYYDLIEYKQGGQVVGYVAAGYTRDPNFNNFTMYGPGPTLLDCYTKTATYFNCKYFSTAEDPFGFSRQLVVFYDLDGNVTDYFRYNFGQFWGVAQDDNEDIYLFGQGENPRNLIDAEGFDTNTDPALGTGNIYYNPTTSTQSTFPFSCLSSDPFARKFNIVKINLSGQVIWNNYYGLEDNPGAAHSLSGLAHTGVFKGNTLLAGGTTVMNDDPKKFLVSINKTTGNVIWKDELEPSSNGEIYQIVKKNNQYLISGIDYLTTWPTDPEQGFCALVTDNGTISNSSFTNPIFYHIPSDIPPSVDTGGLIDPSEPGRSTSAIFTDNYLYWFVVANKTWGGPNGKGEGIVVQMDLQGNMLSMDAFGEIRAFDLWISGTPTDDGGFALVTTRHTPIYFNTTNTPGLSTPMDLANPSGPTMGDCLMSFDSSCDEINDPFGEFWDSTSKFWQLVSTCAYVRKYDSTFNLQWDKIWDSTDNSPRECYPGNIKQQECVYRIVQSSVDGGLALCGNTSDNRDDCYIVKLENDCGLSDFYGMPTAPDLIVDYTDGVYDINTNTTWTTPKKVLGTVRIKPGKTLTILNTTVEFATLTNVDGSIDVEQNAYLIVDGATLTSGGECDDFWRGISVWGDSNENQYYDSGAGLYHQGRVLVKNQSTIEYANTAIRNLNPSDGNQTGGIIKVENSEFLNCHRAIEFKEYQNTNPSNPVYTRPDLSRIYKTNFTVDNSFPLDLTIQAPKSQITLWKTDRVAIEGCNFTNDATVPQSEYRGKAIYSHDANYIVKGYCPSPVPIGGCATPIENTFTGWFKGIEALGSASSRPVTVTASVFDKNMIGVELSATDYSQIYDNEFELGDHPYFADLVENTNVNNLGVYSLGVLHFSIEDNTFNQVQGSQYEGHGIVVKDSEGAENQVYKNKFNELETGTDGTQVNRNTQTEGGVAAGKSGLQFICNENFGNKVDFEISRHGNISDPTYSQSGIRQNQGSDSPNYPAGNIFSAPYPAPNVYTHFKISTDYTYRYIYHTYAPDPNEITPGWFTTPIYVAANRNCPSNYTNGGGTNPGIKTELLGMKAEYEGMIYAYTQLIDNGNTQGTVTDIELTWPQDAWELRDVLIARSPYNSEEVLMAAIQRNIMPNAMLLEVLLANPDALRSGKVIQYAENFPNPPMPQYMIDLLYASSDQTTIRTIMENTIADLHLELQRLQKKIILTKATADETYSAPDSTLYYLRMVKTVEGNYSRAAAMTDRKMYAQAINLIDSMQNTYRLETDRYNEMESLKSLYSFIEGVDAAGRNIANLNNAEIDDLKMIAEDLDAGRAAQKAQNALCFHYNICYDSKGSPKSNTSAPRKPKPSYDELIAKYNTASAYPNPADPYITVAYTFLMAYEESSLKVFDNLGKQILTRNLGKAYQGQEIIDTRKLPNGLYLFQVMQNGKKVSDGKFVVTH